MLLEEKERKKPEVTCFSCCLCSCCDMRADFFLSCCLRRPFACLNLLTRSSVFFPRPWPFSRSLTLLLLLLLYKPTMLYREYGVKIRNKGSRPIGKALITPSSRNFVSLNSCLRNENWNLPRLFPSLVFFIDETTVSTNKLRLYTLVFYGELNKQ